jgi:hypothetical protein
MTVTTVTQPSSYIGIFEAARIAGRNPNYLRRCDAVLCPIWVCGRRMYSRATVERWAGQIEARRLARLAKRASRS